MRQVRFADEGRIFQGRAASSPEGGEILIDSAGRAHDPEQVSWLPPFEPGKIFGLALNYSAHADELDLDLPDEPVIFMKPPTTIIGHRAPIVYPEGVTRLHYETELAVVIGRRCRDVRPRRARQYVGGYTIFNDVTARDYVNDYYRPPTKAKGFDTFGPIGPYLVSAEAVEDPHDLNLQAEVNGELTQEGYTGELIHGVDDLIAYISRFATLMPGDVISTGTPRGISFVEPGDKVRLTIDHLGRLENPIVAESSLPLGD